MENKIRTDKTTSEQIKLRNSWLKIFVVASITSVVCYKIFFADFSHAFDNFDFSDLLSLFLATFSIALAVLFYLKATDTSNVFYDNTYRFTRDVSEILGRVEAGFGEKLKNLDQGYSGIKSTLEKLPFDKNQAEQNLEETEKRKEHVEKEREKLIEELFEKARIEGEEKKELFERLKKQDEDLASAKQEISRIKSGIQFAEIDVKEDDAKYQRFVGYFEREIYRRAPASLIASGSVAQFSIWLKNFIAEQRFPPQFQIDLRRFRIVDDNLVLTENGIRLIKQLMYNNGLHEDN